MIYEDASYLCEIIDSYDDKPEPDWSKVPNDKRDMVRTKWLASQEHKAEHWHIWGIQLPFYLSQSKYKITVIGKCLDVCPDNCPARPK